MTAEAAIKAACTRFLSGHGNEGPGAALRRLADAAPRDEAADVYGAGGAVARLEAHTAALLGKPAVRFFIKGVTAQLCTLRVHAEAAGRRTVALHPLSHLDHDEANGIERVGGLRAIRLGRQRPFTAATLDAVTEPLAAVVVELPLRRAGYLLPVWDDLRAISAWCRDRGVAFHIDGARVWESAAGYGVDLPAIAALADTVYVSFYKGLGGLGGAAIVGESEHIRALAPWKTRFGGDLYTAYPQALSALAGIEAHLPRMADYVARARRLAELLREVPRLIVNPATPHTNAFQLHFPGDPAELTARHLALASRHGVWLFSSFFESPFADRAAAEVVIGAAADGWSDAHAGAWIGELAAGCPPFPSPATAL